MSAKDACAVRRCRHARDSHIPETVNYTSIDGRELSFVAHGRCTEPGCTCNGFSMVNSLQPTRPCTRCGEEFLAEPSKTLCPECAKPGNGRRSAYDREARTADARLRDGFAFLRGVEA